MQEREKVVVSGATGMDGSHLVDLLLFSNKYEVYGVATRTSTPNTQNLAHIKGTPYFSVIEGDITDPSSVFRIVNEIKPAQLYNFAAQSHVKTSFDEPLHTFDATAVGAINIFEACRQCSPKTKIYNASSSEMFGDSLGTLVSAPINGNPENGNAHYRQSETTPMLPNSPYAVAKLAAYHMGRIYRDSYGMFICNGILFNHEGPRRGEKFVTRKITKYVAELACNRNADTMQLQLGNLDASRDWGYAVDYVRAAYLMLQQEKPGDYVVATGETYTVRDFLTEAFKTIGIDDWTPYVNTVKDMMRPKEVHYLCGDASKAQQQLDWAPSITFKELVKLMVEHDINEYRKSHV